MDLLQEMVRDFKCDIDVVEDWGHVSRDSHKLDEHYMTPTSLNLLAITETCLQSLALHAALSHGVHA